jgi:pimeloyl-ACP methyl ester carboxylesterase
MTKLHYGSVHSDGIRIQYYMTGEEKPPILLVHGFSDNGFCWNRIPVHLAKIYNVVVMDTRGHGFSGCGNEPFTPNDEARDMVALVNELNLHKPVIMGHSHGASIAAAAAADFPNVFLAAVLIDPPWGGRFEQQTDEDRQTRADEWRAGIAKMKAASHEEVMQMGKQKHPGWDESEYFQWAQSKHQMQDNAFLAIVKAGEAWQEQVARIKCPGLLMTGDPQKGGLVTPEIAAEAKKIWKNLETMHFLNAGHNIHRDSYREFLNGLDPFLKKIRRANPG